MTEAKRILRLLSHSVLVSLMILLAFAAAAAEEPSRFDVLYDENLEVKVEPIELNATIMQINLLEGFLIVAERKVLLLEDGLPSPLARTALYGASGAVIPATALEVKQRVSIKGWRHRSGQVIAAEVRQVN